MRDAAVDADLGGRVETQAKPFFRALQTMLQIGLQAFRVEVAEQGLASEVTARAVAVAECLTPAQGAPGRGDAVDEAQALGRLDQPFIDPGQHRRVEHHHATVEFRAAQRRVQVQHTAQRMADTPHRGVLLFEVMQQLVHQALPVVVHREARVVGMLGQVAHLVIRRQGGEQLAVGGRGETIGVGEEDLLRHGRLLCTGKDGPLSASRWVAATSG